MRKAILLGLPSSLNLILSYGPLKKRPCSLSPSSACASDD